MRSKQLRQREWARCERLAQLPFAAGQADLRIGVFLELPAQRRGEMRQALGVVVGIRPRAHLPIDALGHGQQRVRRVRRERVPCRRADGEIAGGDHTPHVVQRDELLRLERAEEAVGGRDGNRGALVRSATRHTRQHLDELQLIVQIGLEPEDELVTLADTVQTCVPFGEVGDRGRLALPAAAREKFPPHPPERRQVPVRRHGSVVEQVPPRQDVAGQPRSGQCGRSGIAVREVQCQHWLT